MSGPNQTSGFGRFVRLALPRLALVVASLALTLLALEAVVRFGLNEGSAFLLKDAIIGQRYRPSTEEHVYVPSSDRVVHRSFNHLGFRGPDRQREKPAGTRRVALLGDSFTASNGIDDDRTLDAVLERLLVDGTGEPWEVLNFAVDGFSTAQSLLTWRHFGRDFAPDVVVLCFFNGNDVSDNDRRFTSAPRPYFSLDDDGELVFHPISEVSARLSGWLGEHSHLYVWQKRRFGQLRAWRNHKPGQPPGVVKFLDADPPPLVRQSWALTEKLVAVLADEVAAAGAAFVLVSIPDVVQVRDAAWEDARRLVDPAMAPRLRRDLPEQRLAAVARERGILFVPLLEALRARAQEEDLYFADGHWNAAGIRVGAERIHAALAESGSGF